jgi:membrane fusion protein, heavy metal efflux system
VTAGHGAQRAAPGLLVQPGNAPAPYSVADVSTKWMLANVTESDSPLFHVGAAGRSQGDGLSGPRVLRARFPRWATRRGSEHPPGHHPLRDCRPQNELRPGMLANFVIRVQDPVESIAIPMNGVVREAMARWRPG